MPWFLLFVACARPPECPPCAADTPGAVTLAPWEAALLAGTLDDLRSGIRGAGDQAFGLCAGRTACESFVGASPPDPLSEGDWFVRAELLVPAAGEGWTVLFHVECTTHPGAPEAATQVHDRQYPVKFMGRDRPYRLSPLWKIRSPHPGGPQACTWSLTPVRPDGVRGDPWTGAYRTLPPPPPPP